jgi:hypothetical protein
LALMFIQGGDKLHKPSGSRHGSTRGHSWSSNGRDVYDQLGYGSYKP